MSNQFTLEAELRSDLGKGASRRLRREDKVPAVLYGEQKEAVSLTLPHNKVFLASQNEAFYSHILTLNLGGDQVQALVKDIQRHPFKPQIMHLDFQRVDSEHKIHTKVPVHFVNESTAPAVKGGATVAHHINEVEVSCFPQNLPEFVEVDIATMEIGQTLHMSDIVLAEGVELVELAKGADHDQAVVTLNAKKGSDEEASEEEAPAAE